ncbi:aminotransferase class V-fold PLP-dependent enzyme [Janibacter sp. YIM B02568]|uniref:aminotransferase class I/II-fold pyridoxal phosphate-dependent enzyme n=1 Tax=Janibacter endophyticus TaxID=2806261 RepID=UPI00195109CE|nr:aminotransferase class V-fold PLP-dependent enzyme [Janibacter endophyticus]MBM6545020.1 aminotransferase class V-fold PLP-dependent enzyme [Janibacter endophyticus]
MPTDPRDLRDDAPLLDGWLRFYEAGGHPFTVPGHKQQHDLVGDVVAGDAPMYGAVDTVGLAHGRLAEAERRAAALWGGDVAHLSTGGSTHGNQALALAVGRPGARVVIGRTAHRSLHTGLVLAGLDPVWLPTDVDRSTGMPRPTTPDDVRAALTEAPDAVAVFVTDPSYVGTYGDIAGIVAVARKLAPQAPVIVDAAWAAHFGFHPDLPPHAIAQGADAIVTSAHKALPAWSQAAIVVARTERISAERLEIGIHATMSTSPAGAIFASADAARALLAQDGEELIGRTLDALAGARHRLAEVEGLVVVSGEGVDPLKLTLVLAGTGADGTRVEADLIAAGMPLEMANRDTCIAMVTLADDAAALDALVNALVESIERHRGEPRPVAGIAAYGITPVMGMTPREAFFADRVAVPVREAVGRVGAELIAPYPPGIPVLAPGEVVTEQVVGALEQARASGSRIAYAADPTGATITVVA